MSTPRRIPLDIVDDRGEIRELVVRFRRAAGMLEAWLAAREPYDTAQSVRRRAYGMIPPLEPAHGQDREGVA